MLTSRIQLTLFVHEAAAVIIEQIREKYNPSQYALIKSHVTLCREDELTNIDVIKENLNRLQHSPICIQFGKPILFNNGKGVYLPGQGDNLPFHNLRKSVLQNTIPYPRIANPHITYIHPRNASCTNEIFAQICTYDSPQELYFDKISLIEQYGSDKWQILESFTLL